ncbi:GlsB/YeaQ/YmgE family stress response membrane protein [Sphingosinicella sp.]|uniref:GlsB/YeaQ/YmgE family stress response membrane protein n=1 Tax=Sphingosinicella sp. TaxID=1917971 RepID=UPI004038064F
MGIIVWLVVGGIIGWVASMIMRTDAQQGILLNVVVGIVGAAIAGFLFGGRNINNVNWQDPMAWVYSLVGAVILLGVVNLVRRGRIR